MLKPLRRLLGWVKKHPWKSVGIILAVVLVGGGIAMATRPKQPEYITAKVMRGDLVQTVEAVGSVISERDLKLQFAASGIVDKVFVKERDRVTVGQRLASIRAGNLSADVASASARLKAAQADLQTLVEGSRPEDLVIAEAEVQNKMAALEAAKTSLATAEENLKKSQSKLVTLREEVQVSLKGEASTAGSTVSAEMVTMRTALGIIDDVFANNDVEDVIIRNDPGAYSFMRRMQEDARAANRDMLGRVAPTSPEGAVTFLGQAMDAGNLSAQALSRAFDLVATLPLTSAFTNADRETYKSSIAAEKASVQSSISTLDDAIADISNVRATYDTKIAAEESSIASNQGARDRALSDIRTYETSVRIAQAQLDLKRAGPRKTDIDAARARVAQNLADLQRAQSELADTIIVAPVAGIITKVNAKAGEAVTGGPSAGDEAPITMLGDSPYRVEMFSSEIDIPKVQVGQSGSVLLDAFRDEAIPLVVSQIDPAATDRDGVPKYRIRLDFITQDPRLKIGMTGDVDIVTGMRTDVLSVPLRAVLERADGTRYIRILEAGVLIERDVRVGMEAADGSVEVTGVQEGQEVVVLTKE